MTCGNCQLRPVALRERAAVCATCIWAEREGGYTVGCTIGGRPLRDYMTTTACPIGKHGPRLKYIRWLWVQWYGLPYPLRLLLWAVHEKHPKPWEWPACGCIRWLKDRYTQWRTGVTQHGSQHVQHG